MQDITKFLKRLQTFNFELIDTLDLDQLIKSGKMKGTGRLYYWIGKETKYWDSSTFESEMNLLKEMAVLNACTYDPDVLDRILQELDKIKSKFVSVWNNFHSNYSEWDEEFSVTFINDIGLSRFFLVNNYVSTIDDLSFSKDCVEAISDSLTFREKLLMQFIGTCKDLCDPYDTLEVVQAYRRRLKRTKKMAELAKVFGSIDKTENITSAQKSEDTQSELAPSEVVPVKEVTTGVPSFTEGYGDTILRILNPYFPDEQLKALSDLISKKIRPESFLTFNGYGNQLADAFKQLYDSNIIVGCKKNELERWININFNYVSQGVAKEFSEMYLSKVISSDSKPCKSPILDVKKKDGKLCIEELLRNKKNSKF